MPVLQVHSQHSAVLHAAESFRHSCQSHFGFVNESLSPEVAGLVTFSDEVSPTNTVTNVIIVGIFFIFDGFATVLLCTIVCLATKFASMNVQDDSEAKIFVYQFAKIKVLL